jgi:2-iminobutanoate/2-iminopropanoate deaminase
MEHIFTTKAPKPAGHYSQAVIAGGFVFVSGQLPIHPMDGKIPSDIESQAEQVMKNLQHILEASGSSLQEVAKTTVYISDISLWGTVNEIYAQQFGDHKPARSVVPTRKLPFDCLIEMEAVAERAQ